MSEKTGKQWNVEYMNEEIQRTNRFYASTNGGYLWKWKIAKEFNPLTADTTKPSDMDYWNVINLREKTPTDFIPKEYKSYQNMLSASGVTILNEFDSKPIEERKINYRYYLRECYKIIEELKPRQLSLF